MRHGLQLKSTRQKLNGRHTAITCHCGVVVEVVYRWSPLSLSCTDRYRYLNSSNSSTESLEALDWLKWIFKGPPKQRRENLPTTTLFSRGSHPVSHATGDSWCEPPLVLEEGQTVCHILQDHIAGVQKSLVSCVWKEGRMSEGPEDALVPWSPVRQQMNRVEPG